MKYFSHNYFKKATWMNKKPYRRTPNSNVPPPQPRPQLQTPTLLCRGLDHNPKPQRSFCHTPNPNVINDHTHSGPNKIHTKPHGKCKKGVHTFYDESTMVKGLTTSTSTAARWWWEQDGNGCTTMTRARKV